LPIATFFLWFTPAFLLLAGFFIVRRMMVASQHSGQNDGALSSEEQDKLHRLLDNQAD